MTVNYLLRAAQALILGVAASVSVIPLKAFGDDIGTSCDDCVTYAGAFVLHNETGIAIHYEVKWGAASNWHKITLETGRRETHKHALDQSGRAPTPYVRFDKDLHDHKVTEEEYEMDFSRVSSGGYLTHRREAEPLQYRFVRNGNGTLDIRRE